MYTTLNLLTLRHVLAMMAMTLALLWSGAPGGADCALSASPSLQPGMPPEIVSKREIILTPAQYADLAGQWQAYVDAHPQSAAALVQLVRALYYAGQTPIAQQHELLEQAHALDPDCPEVLLALADTGIYRTQKLVEDKDEAIALAERAEQLAPGWAYPHFTLYSLNVIQGRHDEARRHLGALIDKGGITKPVLDYSYNMLVSAKRDAVIFTNGDNDTYPALALQARYGIRTDVRVANLSLLNSYEYARDLWRDSLARLPGAPGGEDHADAVRQGGQRQVG